MSKFELPFVARARFDRIWRENAELRNALKNANEERRKLRLIVADRRPASTLKSGADHA